MFLLFENIFPKNLTQYSYAEIPRLWGQLLNSKVSKWTTCPLTRIT